MPPNIVVGQTLQPAMPVNNISTKPLTPRLSSRSSTSTLDRQRAKKVAYGKSPHNRSILNFFKKVEPSKDDESLFVGRESQEINNGTSENRPASPSPLGSGDFDDIYGADDLEDEWYNQANGLVKRRRLDEGADGAGYADEDNIKDFISTKQVHSPVDIKGSRNWPLGICTPPPATDSAAATKPKMLQKGPFLVDSDSEGETREATRMAQTDDVSSADHAKLATEVEAGGEADNQFPKECFNVDESKSQQNIKQNKPTMNLLEVSNVEARMETRSAWAIERQDVAWNVQAASVLKGDDMSYDESGRFDGIENYQDEDDEFADGEEFVERKWMEEQARLFAAEYGSEDNGYHSNGTHGITAGSLASEKPTQCPVCDGDLGDLSCEQVSRHVNDCLDGYPILLPDKVKAEPAKVKPTPSSATSCFAKDAIPGPGQANPFELNGNSTAPLSAFSKLMASHAENAAWASAEAAENLSRGKPAYQRTCPFYKILPGFSICVDAFRYGAVQGCNAYFLSHFHSDHYVGLSSKWCHGPIYCSRVTANLVKQQLRVDPKWVFPLEFETRTEVPDTEGVAVTMIPANHCPGSSLFLFEKNMGRDKSTKVQRILHCGDFRACPAHISHPLLMPDVIDSITGKSKHQGIDVCYLDTTYLNPRYAFPPQEDVIKACADMCVSLRKERAEDSDAWEMVKKERAGSSMVKFIGTTAKREDNVAMKVDSSKTRGRLLVICGTYSIGKEKICMGIAKALDCKIWAPLRKQRICAALEDPELMSRLTDDPREAQIHMQTMMEMRAETLQDYLEGFKPHFSRIVGFRPSGWNYRPPNSR